MSTRPDSDEVRPPLGRSSGEQAVESPSVADDPVVPPSVGDEPAWLKMDALAASVYGGSLESDGEEHGQ